MRIGSYILNENEGTNMKRARKLCIANGYNDESAWKLITSIRNNIPNVRLADCKFLEGVTRMFLSHQLTRNILFPLNITLELVASPTHIKDYDNNLNGMDAKALVDKFASVVAEKSKTEREELSKVKREENTSYRIVPIDNFEAASQYGKYTTWCVTHDPSMYASYTNDGEGRFYFCLRNDFEHEPEVIGENCPLDSYGLSMIAVSVDKSGNPNTITCRWNHDNNGDDRIMTTEQLSNIIGRNFYDVFKPYDAADLQEKIQKEQMKTKQMAEKKLNALKNGVSLREAFIGDIERIERLSESKLYIVFVNKLYNILNEETLSYVFDEWMKDIVLMLSIRVDGKQYRYNEIPYMTIKDSQGNYFIYNAFTGKKMPVGGKRGTPKDALISIGNSKLGDLFFITEYYQGFDCSIDIVDSNGHSILGPLADTISTFDIYKYTHYMRLFKDTSVKYLIDLNNGNIFPKGNHEEFDFMGEIEESKFIAAENEAIQNGTVINYVNRGVNEGKSFKITREDLTEMVKAAVNKILKESISK